MNIQKNNIEISKKKCFYCNKKINTTQTITNKCKCGNLYCNKHIFFKNHECSFDYINYFKIFNSSNLNNNLELENKFIRI